MSLAILHVLLVVLTVLFLVVSVHLTPLNKCKNGPPPLKLTVNGCDEFPCPLVRGSTLKAQWDFKVIADTATLTPRVRVKILGGTIDYPYPEKDACKSLVNGRCPLDEDEEVTYALTMPISKFYPLVSLNIEFALIDEAKKEQVCFNVDAKVTG